MSALKRLLTNSHKLHKHNSLPPSADGHIDYLDLERVNKHKRCKSKPTTPTSATTPTYNAGFPISGSPITRSSTTSSPSSSNSNLRHGRSRSRARAKHERAQSLDVRVARSTQDSLRRAEQRKNSYETVSSLLSHSDLWGFLRWDSYDRRFLQDPLKDNYGELPLNMSQEGIGQFIRFVGPTLHSWITPFPRPSF